MHEQLMYNPWTGLFYWKINKGNGRIKAGSVAGSKDSNGYILIGIDKKVHSAHCLAWFYVHDYFPENDIDHKDRIRHHNWISNLREVSRSCNTRNTGNRKDNISGVKGVCFHKLLNKWQVKITINQKQKYIGVHKDFDEAVCHRLAAEQCVGWEGCDSISPAFQYVKKIIQ